MNANSNSRTFLVPVAIAVVAVVTFSVGVYFWWPKDSRPPQEDPKKPPIAKNGKDKNGELPSAAKPLNNHVTPVSFSESLDFLDEDADAIQEGMDPTINDRKRAAALRGQVFKNDKEPFAGVKISIQNEPRYGVGATKKDGAYTMRVNGGSLMTVGYQSEGYLPVWRQAAAPWLDYAWLPPVVMTTVDSKVTPVKSGEKQSQIARASVVKDKDGTRQTTLVFPSGARATMELADGTKKPLDSLHVRATEYTAGDKGPERMPAPLPANSAYTYCVELSADEAIAAGAKTVHFDKAVVHYVENFLNFPVGIPVPCGYFDTQKLAWVASDSGRVIKILAINNKLADLDIAGKGQAANAKELDSLKITDDERKELAKLYVAGTSLWRVLIPHFSIWDLNWGFSPPKDAMPPRMPPPFHAPPEGAHKPFHRHVDLPGIDWKLNYHSDRTPGATGPRTVHIPVSGKDLPKSVKRIDIEILIAGQRIVIELPAKGDQVYIFIWDGKDCHGRPAHGAHNVRVRIGYVYDGVYEQTARFGNNSNGEIITGSRTRQEVVLWQEHALALGYLDARVFGLGGWNFDGQHAYDPAGRILYLSNGERHMANPDDLKRGNLTITTVAGGGTKGIGDDGPATLARLDDPDDGGGAGTYRGPRFARLPRCPAVAPDGTLFIADANHRIRRVDLDGTITTVAGGGKKAANSGRATDLRLARVAGLALAPDGSFYFSECDTGHRVLRVDRDGNLTTIAGANDQGFAGDGGPAAKAMLHDPTGLALAPDGSLYIADQANHCIRRITPDGIINTIAGRGGKKTQGYGGDNGPAIKANLHWPTSIALAPDGSLYVADQGNYVIRMINTSGIITTVAGSFRGGWKHQFGGDDGPALKATLDDPTGIAVAADGSLYIADTYNHRIRRVGPDGILRTFAGAKPSKEHGDFGGDNGPASLAKLSNPSALAFGPDGSLYFYDASYQRTLGKPPYRDDRQRVRRISPPLPGFTNTQIAVPSADGKELYKFNAVGQHLETLDAATKEQRLRLDYDHEGRLMKFEDAKGAAVTIERDENGRPHAFVAGGKKTAVEVNADGFLERLTFPGGAENRYRYSTDGLLREPALNGGAK